LVKVLIINSVELENLTYELSDLKKMHPTIGMITNDRKSAGHSIKVKKWK